jgi:hypothetical protein
MFSLLPCQAQSLACKKEIREWSGGCCHFCSSSSLSLLFLVLVVIGLQQELFQGVNAVHKLLTWTSMDTSWRCPGSTECSRSTQHQEAFYLTMSYQVW